jgi:hypothetical protein
MLCSYWEQCSSVSIVWHGVGGPEIFATEEFNEDASMKTIHQSWRRSISRSRWRRALEANLNRLSARTPRR